MKIYTDGNGYWTFDWKEARKRDCYLPDARELYNYIDSETDKYDQWDAVAPDVFEQLADTLDIDIDSFDGDTDAFMAACRDKIEQEER